MQKLLLFILSINIYRLNAMCCGDENAVKQIKVFTPTVERYKKLEIKIKEQQANNIINLAKQLNKWSKNQENFEQLTESKYKSHMDHLNKLYNRINGLKIYNKSFVLTEVIKIREKIIRKITSDILNINLLDSTNNTPLIYAALINNRELVKELIAKGADLNKQNDHGFTALHTAAFMDHFLIVKILLDNKARTDLKNNNGFTPYDYAKYWGNLYKNSYYTKIFIN